MASAQVLQIKRSRVRKGGLQLLRQERLTQANFWSSDDSMMRLMEFFHLLDKQFLCYHANQASLFANKNNFEAQITKERRYLNCCCVCNDGHLRGITKLWDVEP